MREGKMLMPCASEKENVSRKNFQKIWQLARKPYRRD